MPVLSPAPLRPGDMIAVTAPSSGVPDALRARLEVGGAQLEALGFRVRLGECLMGTEIVSAPVADRAAELQAYLTDPEVSAVVPPWGGELAVELLPHLDLAAVRADPTWLLGWSDLSTLLLPLTLQAGIVTAYGQNLMDTPYRVPAPLLPWTDVLTGAGPFTQGSAEHVRLAVHDDYATDPGVPEFTFDTPGGWRGPDVQLTGRLVGGCIETVSILAGWFDEVIGVLIGRTTAPASGAFTQDDAVDSALAGLDLPVVRDVDCGHVPPHLLLNGALAEVTVDGPRRRIVQHLP